MIHSLNPGFSQKKRSTFEVELKVRFELKILEKSAHSNDIMEI